LEWGKSGGMREEANKHTAEITGYHAEYEWDVALCSVGDLESAANSNENCSVLIDKRQTRNKSS
jgi:hypothetical protein